MYYTIVLVVRNGSYVIEYTVVHIEYIWPSNDLHKYPHQYYPVLLMHSTSQQTVGSADGLQDNSQHRKMLGIKTAIYAPSIPPDLCISSRGSSVTCRRASLTSFRGCDPDVANSAGNGGLPPRHPLSLRRWLEDKTRGIAASATKKRLSLSLLPTTRTLGLCPTNSRVSLRRRRCPSPKAVPPCVSIT